MTKLVNALLLVFVIEASLIFFGGQSGIEQTSLLYFLENVIDWTTASWLNLVLTSVTGLGGVILIGAIATGRDWIWRAGLAGTFLTFGVVIAHLWTFVNAFIQGYAGDASVMLTTIIISPLMVYFLVAIIDFVTGK